MIPNFIIFSPTIKEWLAIIQARRAELLNPRRQMTVLLDRTREDIDKQFDENQGKWKPLASYTKRKKADKNADPRILHETRQGQGLRLRDAYAQAGTVDNMGVLTMTYPDEKPYAKEHQLGVTATDKEKKPKKKRRRNRLDKWNDDLDEEYRSRFF